jgi:hypothetical protein
MLSALMDEWLELPEDRRAAWLDSLETAHADLLPALRELLSQPAPAFLESLPEIGDDPLDPHPAPELGSGVH